MLFLSRSTFLDIVLGTRSHCSGVLLRRTAPPCTVRTPWWIISIPEFFSSLNPPLKLLLNTSTLTPCRSKYSRSLSLRSWALTINGTANSNSDNKFFISPVFFSPSCYFVLSFVSSRAFTMTCCTQVSPLS